MDHNWTSVKKNWRMKTFFSSLSWFSSTTISTWELLILLLQPYCTTRNDRSFESSSFLASTSRHVAMLHHYPLLQIGLARSENQTVCVFVCVFVGNDIEKWMRWAMYIYSWIVRCPLYLIFDAIFIVKSRAGLRNI